VRAVNLIPADERSGADRSGGAVYIFLGILTALVVLTAAWVLINNQVSSNQSELVQLRADTTAAQQQAAALAPFRSFATMRQKRVETVKSLANSRFDWGPVLRKMAMVLPRDVWLTSMVGTVTPGVTVEGSSGGGGDTSSLRSSWAGPAVELTGCTSSQAEVARVMTRLRLIDGVTRVSLSSSKKNEKGTVDSKPSATDTATGSGAGASADCRGGKDIPQFSIVVFFNPVGTDAVPVTGGAAPAAGTTPAAAAPGTPGTPAPTTGTQPGATQPTSGSGGSS
jgi:Tfp pilus assembly protein PilN